MWRLRGVRAICALLATLMLTGACGGVHGQGTGPSLPDLVVPLTGNPVAGAAGELTLERYVSEFATVPDKERERFVQNGFVGGWLRSTLDDEYGRRVYLLKFRDPAAARDVYGWYQSFAATGLFEVNLNREHFGRIANYQTNDKRQATYAQVMFAAGPFVAVASVTIAAGGSTMLAKDEVSRIAVAESKRLP
jgi:hypothetical protein